MKKFILRSFILVVSLTFFHNSLFAATPSFNSENAFNFSVKTNLIEANKIQLYARYQTLDQAKKNEFLRQIDKHNILQQYYPNLGNVLVIKEVFLINTPQSELDKNIYKQPSVQNIFFPNSGFYDCNMTSCKAKKIILGTRVSFTAYYDFSKNNSDSTYTIEQFGTNWSAGFNNALSISTISKYGPNTSLVTAYQISILQDGIGFLQNQIIAEAKRQILNFHSCFQTQRCQKSSALFF